MSGDAEPTPLNLPETEKYTHRAHRFPGKFHPPLVNQIIENNPDHELIADPMCGSGTVGVEGVVHGMDVLCVDIDPLSCLMTRGKSRPVNPDDFRNVGKRILSLIDKFPTQNEVEDEQALIEVRENLESTPSVPPLNLLHWFEPHVAIGYSRILRVAWDVLEIESNRMQDAIKTVLASIIRKLSRADPQPVSGLEVTSVRREQLENGLEFDVEQAFRRAVNRMANGYEELNKVHDIGESTVIEGDSRRFSDIAAGKNSEPTMVITSPPYCNAIEYSRRHRLEYEWLGLFKGDTLDEQGDNRLERSRNFFGSPTPLQDELKSLPEVPHVEVHTLTEEIENEAGEPRKANLLRKYFLDAYEWMEQIYRVLPRGGLFFMTIGPSTSYGRRIRTPDFLTDIAIETGFTLEETKTYKITNNKMQYPTNGPTTDTESLIQFQKE